MAKDTEHADADIDDFVLIGEAPFVAKREQAITALARLAGAVSAITGERLLNMTPERLEELRGQLADVQKTLGDLSTSLYVAVTLGQRATMSLPHTSGEVHDAFVHRDTARR